ncbi:GTPase [Pseudomonas sp. HR96]|uniref:GTPase family protein n=1 Tax=Pseudomonas sp. HR96 TaxID=1027966 RepID=UPI002A752E70|nr:GTPase [Pseudomonas sp. HR96]WPP00088.1 GTPase [Pseudomonas sp. HR96]
MTRLLERTLPLLLIAALAPLLALAGFGVYAVFHFGYLLPFVVVLVVLLLMGLLPWWVLKRRVRTQAVPALDVALEQSLETPSYWTERDRQAHAAVLPHVQQMLAVQPEWPALPDLGLEVLRLVAARYSDNPDTAAWAFTPIEFLAIAEQVSRRYREVLKANVPMIERMKISSLMTLGERVERYGPWLMNAYNLYRKARWFSPQGVLAELRGHLSDKALGGLSDEFQLRLKHLLLLEVLQVAIDLYGGHFRFDDADLPRSDASDEDRERMAAAPEALRVCLIGQVGAGKSTLVNVLTASIRAEVSALPATDKVQVYACSVDGEEAMNLVDLPGLNGDGKLEKKLFEQVIDCDLVLWVLKANQPARALDQHFRGLIEAWESANNDRKPPVLVGVMNQVDRLVPPGAWNPEDPAQAKLIKQALDYNRELLDLDHIVPLAVPEEQPHFNVPALLALLQERYEEGLNVQLNRRRQEAGEFSASREIKRVRHAAASLFSLIQR